MKCDQCGKAITEDEPIVKLSVFENREDYEQYKDTQKAYVVHAECATEAIVEQTTGL